MSERLEHDNLSSCQHLQKVPRQRLTDDTHFEPGLPRPFEDIPRAALKVSA